MDSNTYNEAMRICHGNDKDAPFSETDVKPSSLKLNENHEQNTVHDSTGLLSDVRRDNWYYDYMRRHEHTFVLPNSSYESFTEEDIHDRILRSSQFFDLPIPELISKSDVLAKITYHENNLQQGKITYNLPELTKIGINNKDTFEALLIHELSHQFLAHKEYKFCINSNWSKELACDFIVGVMCSRFMLATGKYKNVVKYQEASDTHPKGNLRLKAVIDGFNYSELLFRQGISATITYALMGVNHFLCVNSKLINDTFLDWVKNPPPAYEEPYDVMNLPDNNLVKQYVLNYRKQNNL